jgi:putative peptidoglycan lipid II flippase
MPGLFFIALNRILAPAFYAQSDSKSPTLAGVISFVVNMTLAAILVGLFKGAGIAFALSLASAVNTILLLVFLRRNPQIRLDKALRSALVYIAKLILFSCIAALPVRALSPRILALFAGHNRIIACGVPLILNAVIFGAVGIVLLVISRDKQMRGIWRMARRKG